MLKSFKNINTLGGWIMFVVASIVYILTTEATSSIWDCPEFIATAVKLQIGHPPGAPLFQMLGAVIANGIATDPSQLPYIMNVFAAVAGGFSIMILFWCTTYFTRRALGHTKSWDGVSLAKAIIILGSGVVGAAAILFSDTFWFNATESEVYSLATAVTVLVFYLAIKWEQGFGKPRNNKWLLLIGLVVGMGPGVHFMVLLAIPSVVMIYYFRTVKTVTFWNFVWANVVAAAILGFIFVILFPLIISTFGMMELFSVNTLGMPFNSGMFFALALIVAILIFLIVFTRRKGWMMLNTMSLFVTFVVIGFSVFMMVIIRANARPAINENDPSDAVRLLSYFNRDQYGSNSLFYGPAYNANIDRNDPIRVTRDIYEKNTKTGKYEIVDQGFDYNYLEKDMSFFPRIQSSREEHARNYRQIAGLREGQKPTFGHNLYYFLNYQMGYMNMRYFMWNFSGRQNDYQGRLEPTKGNWMTGIGFIDTWRLGPQDGMPDYMQNNKAHNNYYMLPFLLGALGILFQLGRSRRDFYSILMMFLLTGAAITFYTNNPPFEPRERDYALCVSFWTFGIWIGLGAAGIWHWLNELQKGKNAAMSAALVSLAAFLGVPALMAAQNWDDHDRSSCTTAIAVGTNYLTSTDPNAMLVTYGDNDTFPLWHMQEVLDYRTDVRIINTSLLQADWYIDQLKDQYHENDIPLPISLEHEHYREGTNDYITYREGTALEGKPLDVKTLIEIIRQKPSAMAYTNYRGKTEVSFPSRIIRIPVNKENVLKYGIVQAKDSALIEPYIDIEVAEGLYKTDVILLDILANFNWERPLYFAIAGGSGGRNYLWLENYLQLEGMAYKLVPIKRKKMAGVDPQRIYQSVEQWNWSNIKDPKCYMGEAEKRPLLQMRQVLNKGVEAFLQVGDTVRAKELINLSVTEMPLDKFEPFYYHSDLIDLMLAAGQKEEALVAANRMMDQLATELFYYGKYPQTQQMRHLYRDIIIPLEMYNRLLPVIEKTDPESFPNREQEFGQLYNMYSYMFRQ